MDEELTEDPEEELTAAEPTEELMEVLTEAEPFPVCVCKLACGKVDAPVDAINVDWLDCD